MELCKIDWKSTPLPLFHGNNLIGFEAFFQKRGFKEIPVDLPHARAAANRNVAQVSPQRRLPPAQR